ncbi:hypothetical protein MNBD_GAMMA06-160 [hydrothermal vent metagenome]|uniref:Porin domain-containing protein n=1 Tax=hydrothermal vent metagenome TaxID=652676 RepID=A0A3B0WAB3_9ZZZZ
MKKSIISLAVLASMVASSAALAEPKVYGNVHLSINDVDSADNVDMTSNTSSIGVKGSEDLGDGMKAIYKVEFQMDPANGGAANDNNDEGTNGNALTNRDQFVGLKGGMGTIKFGSMSSNYKQMGGKVDSLYRTRLEGRGFLNTQSRLHNGRATNRGRMTDQVQYASPKMSGFQLVANTTFSGADDETVGAGIRWANKSITAYLDFIDTVPGGGSVSANNTESAIKVGGKFKTKAFRVAGQFESAEDLTGFNYIHVNGGFNINKNNSIEATFGTASHINNSNLDTTSFAVAYNHKMSKKTNVYVGYGDRSSDVDANDDTLFTAGIRKKF